MTGIRIGGDDVSYESELYHHGILGMKWGERNGPPYPLSSGAHSAREKKRGTKGWTAEAKADAGREPSSKSDSISKKKTRKSAEDIIKEAKIKSKGQNGLKDTKEEKSKFSKVSSKDINKYRSEMIEKYAKSDPEKANKYKNASEKDLAEEYQRRRDLTKTIAIVAGSVGVAGAIWLACRSGAVKNIAKAGIAQADDAAKSAVKDAIRSSFDDVDYVISKGTIMHRMVGFKDFDLQKTKGQLLYTATNEKDRLAYMAFLRDFNKTGKRYDVSLEAVKDIVAPSDKKALAIFNELIASDPGYKKEITDTLTEMIAKTAGAKKGDLMWDAAEWNAKRMVEADPFQAAITGIANQNSATKKLIDAYKKHGFNGIVDYHDKGTVSELPMILFDAASDVVKRGETAVTDGMRVNAIKLLSKMTGHPVQANASALADLPIDELMQILKG